MDGGAGVEKEMSYRNVLSGAQVFCYCVSTCRQLRLPTSRSKRQLARCCLGVGLHTSTPRASRGATAKTTPCSMLSSASWLWGPSATSILVPGAEVVGAFFATRRMWSGCKLGPSMSAPCPSRLPWIPATTFPPPCSASVLVPSGASRARSRREARSKRLVFVTVSIHVGHTPSSRHE